MRFLSPNSPYISALGGLDLERSLLSVDAEKKTCVFMQMFHDRLQVTTRAQFSDPTVSKPGPYPNPDLRLRLPLTAIRDGGQRVVRVFEHGQARVAPWRPEGWKTCLLLCASPDHLPRLTATCHGSDVANARLAGIAAQMPQALLNDSSSMA